MWAKKNMKLVYSFVGLLGLLIHFAHSVNPGIGLKLNERGFEAGKLKKLISDMILLYKQRFIYTTLQITKIGR